MEFEPEEQEIVELLTKLRNQGGTYPKKLLANRRQVFLRQMAGVGLSLGVGEGIKTVAKAPKGGSLHHMFSISASSFLELVLLLAIITQASIIAYSYRDKIVDYVNSLSAPSSPTTVSIPVTGSSPTEVVVSDTPSATTTVTISVTATPSSTVTTVSSSTSESEEDNSTTSSDPSPGVTPQPTNTNGNPNGDDNGNNGNHYGQTPGPPQPKDEPKPTKKIK